MIQICTFKSTRLTGHQTFFTVFLPWEAIAGSFVSTNEQGMSDTGHFQVFNNAIKHYISAIYKPFYPGKLFGHSNQAVRKTSARD